MKKYPFRKLNLKNYYTQEKDYYIDILKHI